MCLIVASQTGVMLTPKELKNAHLNNPDAWGIVYHDGKRLQVTRGFNLDSMYRAVEKAKGHPYVLHFRWATHGDKSLRNAHPFRLTKDLYMAHNGVLNIATPDPALSDTGHLAKHISGILEKNPEWYNSDGFIPTIETWIGTSNKLAFLDSHGEILIANEQAGRWIDGIWLSNLHSLDDPLEEWETWDSRWLKWTPGKKLDSAVFDATSDTDDYIGEDYVCDYCGNPASTAFDSDGNVVCAECYAAELRYMRWENPTSHAIQ